MRLMKLAQAWFWTRNAWKNFVAQERRRVKAQLFAQYCLPIVTRTIRDAASFHITQDSHPRKVQRMMNRAGYEISTSDLARAAQRHIHPARQRPGAYEQDDTGFGSVDMACLKDRNRCCPDDETCCQ
ncbi:hypothetical protein [Bradyrhizobium erythrophlei]|uniref:Uncharacterized protein n=1 Tax=Bradyrhizobium erythrophlei TaxID=1437360 RepID=A0A1M5T9H8_9BRAD|nr:hypothetical protein [Bradyrhizobium erythrophlei]SHH47435.1 hypothetical protein SAMN05444169_7633 [Bradyrhizobium erythrophlei]